MSESIQISHRGYKIRFGQNSYLWSCHDLDVEDMDLGKVKAAIDKTCLKVRKANSVKAIMYSGRHDDKPRLSDATIIEYLHPITEKTGSFGTGPKVVKDHQVAIMSLSRWSGTGDKLTRSKERLGSLLMDTQWNQEVFAKIVANAKRRAELDAENRRLEGTFQYLKPSDIEALMRIAETGEPDES